MLKSVYNLLSFPGAALNYYNRAYSPAGDVESLPYGDRETLPSMWSYDGKCLPREFYNLEPDTFLEKSLDNNLVFLPNDMLKRICLMLSPEAFIRLSRTCRYLHWMLYTYCTCLVSNDRLGIRHDAVDLLPNEIRIWEDRRDKMTESYRHKEWSFIQPRFLKRPFFVKEIDLYLELGVFEEEIYNRVLKLLNPFEKYYQYIEVINICEGKWPNEDDTRKFIMDLDAVGYRMEKPPKTKEGSPDQRKVQFHEVSIEEVA